MNNDKITILYVDDEPINLMLFELNFKSKYNILIAENAHEGTKILKNNPSIPIVISDLKMPEINGITFLKNVKSSYPKCSCFLLTGFDITPEIQEAIEEKIIIKYLSKPFITKEIIEAIETALN